MAIPTHVAYTDESHHNVGHYRAIGMVSLTANLAVELNDRIQELNLESDVRECKWMKLRNAKYRFAIQKIVNLCLDYAKPNQLRIDVLIWDSHDSRHDIKGRDDNKNLQNMYVQLLKNVIYKRWNNGGLWLIFPDENSIIDWVHVHNILSNYYSYNNDPQNLLDDNWEQNRPQHRIYKIVEADSKSTCLCQVIDIFTGMGVFSYEKRDIYNAWRDSHSPQLHLFPAEPYPFNPKDIEQSTVLDLFLDNLKTKGIETIFESNLGLYTSNPEQIINYWFYKPQRDTDKAPVHRKDLYSVND